MSKRSWELLNSLWIILTFTYFTNFFAFIYAGIRAKNRRWSLYGMIYLLPLVISQFAANYYAGPNPVDGQILPPNPVTDIIGYIFLAAWGISIAHAFYIRKEYLMRLKSLEEVRSTANLHFQLKLKEIKDAEERNLRQNINNEYNENRHEPKLPKMSNNVKEPVSLIVDINNDPEEIIAKLPGVGIILAKKAVELRQISQFRSHEEFGEALGLKPHIVEQIRPSIIITLNEIKIQKRGRLIDI